jgi:hypothetical protein
MSRGAIHLSIADDKTSCEMGPDETNLRAPLKTGWLGLLQVAALVAGDELTERRFVKFVDRVAQLVRSQQFLVNTGP